MSTARTSLNGMHSSSAYSIVFGRWDDGLSLCRISSISSNNLYIFKTEFWYRNLKLFGLIEGYTLVCKAQSRQTAKLKTCKFTCENDWSVLVWFTGVWKELQQELCLWCTWMWLWLNFLYKKTSVLTNCGVFVAVWYQFLMSEPKTPKHLCICP